MMTINRISRLLLTGASLMTVTNAALAQTSAPENPAGDADSQAARGEGDIVVTAQRRGENVQSVPIAIQVIGGDALADKGVRSVQDLAQFTPNVSITSPTGVGGQPSVSIRGIGLNDFNSNNAGPNGIYVDEFYVSAPSAQGLGVYDLERIEVLKGPQGTLYGRNTSGGAINMISTKPSDDFEGYVRGEYSSFDTVSLQAAVGGPITSTLSARVAAMYNYSDGYTYNHLRDRKENGADNISFRTQLLWRPTDRLRILLKNQTTRVSNRPVVYKLFGTLDPLTGEKCPVADVYANRCVALSGYGGRKSYHEGDYNRNEKLRLTDSQTVLRVDYSLGDIDLVSLTGYDYLTRYHPEDSDGAPDRLVELDYGTKSHEFTQELRVGQTRDNYNWVAGGYYLHEILRQDQPLYLLLDLDDLLGPQGGDGIAAVQQTFNRQKTTSYALYGQGEWEVADGLRLIAGARYTWERRDFQSIAYQNLQQGGKDHFGPAIDYSVFSDSLKQQKFNWRLGANYRFTPQTMIYANVATGFKSGGFNGGFISPDPSLRALQLRPFKPETVTAYEAGLKTNIFDRLVTLNLAAFYNDYRNQQVSILAPNPDPAQPSFFALDNAEKARVYGLDAEVTLRPADNLTLAGQLGLLDSKLLRFVASRDVNQPDYSGNRLALAPRTTAAVSIDWTKPVSTGELSVHWDSNYRSMQFFDPSNNPYVYQPGYWLHNARISYKLAMGAEIGLFARNLGKKNYIIWNSDLSDPFGLLNAVAGAPRSFGVDVNFRF